jgi:hypothetical protein
MIPTVALGLKYKGRRPTGRPRNRWLGQVLEDIKETGKGNRKGKIVGR